MIGSEQRLRTVFGTLFIQSFLAFEYLLLIKIGLMSLDMGPSMPKDFASRVGGIELFAAAVTGWTGFTLFMILILWEPAISSFLAKQGSYLFRVVFFSRQQSQSKTADAPNNQSSDQSL